MTLRQRVADRTEVVAGIMELVTFLVTNPEAAELLGDVVPRMTFRVGSKAEADEIIAAYEGAVPAWRNGYYMAEWNPPAPPPKLASSFLHGLPPELAEAVTEYPQEADAFTVELHFAPAITQETGVAVGRADGAS